MDNNGIFEEMVDQAMERVANDSRRATAKDISLVTYGMVTRNFSEKIDHMSIAITDKIDALRKPLYYVAAAIGVAGIAYLVETILTRLI